MRAAGGAWERLGADRHTIAGFASYPIYALHYPLLDLSQKAVLGLGLASVVDLIITVAGIVVAGILAAYLIDLPIRTRLSARFSSTTPQLKPE